MLSQKFISVKTRSFSAILFMFEYFVSRVRGMKIALWCAAQVRTSVFLHSHFERKEKVFFVRIVTGGVRKIKSMVENEKKIEE